MKKLYSAMNKGTLLLTILLFFIRMCAFAQNQGLDPSFANGGILIDTQDRFYLIYDMAVQPDGKIIVAGLNYIARYLPNGKHDSTFGNTGLIAVTNLTDTNGGYASHIFLLSNGKILLTIGQSNVGEFVVRLNPDGSFDSSFGKAGKTNFCCGVLQAAIQPDSKIITAGIEDDDYVAVHRITSSGVIDSTFGINGRSRLLIGNSYGIQVSGIGAMADGHIAVIGCVHSAIYYIRLLANGKPDTNFCNSGFCFAAGTAYCRDAIIYPDGKALVAVGGLSDSANFLERLKADATPDSSFSIDGDGIFAISIPRTNKLLQMPDGRIICAGWMNPEHFAVARVLKDGKGMDTSFGSHGSLITHVADRRDRAYAVQLQNDGKILVGGNALTEIRDNEGYAPSAAIARYLPDAPLKVPAVAQTASGTLTAYPNPAQTCLGVVTPVSGLLQLFSSDGHLLQQQQCIGHVQRLNIAALPQGTYLLKLQAKDKSYSMLFLKE